MRNKTGYQYFRSRTSSNESRFDNDASQREKMAEAVVFDDLDSPVVSIFSNYFFSALAGKTWYFQFFFYTMGETQMGRYKFSSWSLHMASIIIFSTLWGIALKEWKGVRARTKWLVGISLLVLVTSTIVVGYGNYLAIHSQR
jgi:L-rhamnose-H+ transport protein